MSLWSAIRGAFSSGALSNPEKGYQSSGPAGFGNDTTVTVGDERALGVSAVFACIRLIVQSGAPLPLGFYRRTKDGREALPEDHYLCRLLKYKPNLYMTAKSFRQALWMQRVMWGNAYARKIMSGGRTVGLLPLKPAYMQVERGIEGLRYFYSTNTGRKEYSADEIFHWKGFSPDGMIGLSPLAYQRYTLGISVAADKKAATSFSAMPSMGLKLDDYPTPDQQKQLRELYGPGTNMTGDGNFWIFPGGMTPEKLGLPPDDLQMLESRQLQVVEIARFYGVPAVMIDGNQGATSAWPASYEQQVLAFLTFTLKSYLEEFEDQVVASLVAPAERLTVFAEHNVEGFLRADSKARSSYLSTMVSNGMMTRNEARKKENLPPVDGGDELTVQVNMTPLDELEKVMEKGNATE